MRKKIVLFAALCVAIMLSGCCTCRETYSPFLEHVETSLRDSVAPLLSKSLAKNGRDPRLIANDVGEVTDIADGCERIRTHGIDSWAPGSQDGDQ